MDILDQEISELSNSGARMPLYDASRAFVMTHEKEGQKEPHEMYLMMLGPENPKYQQEMAKTRNRANKKKDDHIPSDEEVERERVHDSKMLAKLTVGGEVFMGGEWVDITSENAYEMYYNVSIIRAQALTFMMKPENFVKGC